MNKQDAEKLTLEKIENLSQEKFVELSLKIRKEKWDYVGSNDKNSGDEAYWMRFKNNQFEMITSACYGSTFYLVQETTMDLETLKEVAESVIGFGDGTLNGMMDPEKDDDLATIIEQIAFSLPAHGGHNDTIYNENLEEIMQEEKITIEKAMDNAFKDIAERYDITFEPN